MRSLEGGLAPTGWWPHSTDKHSGMELMFGINTGELYPAIPTLPPATTRIHK